MSTRWVWHRDIYKLVRTYACIHAHGWMREPCRFRSMHIWMCLYGYLCACIAGVLLWGHVHASRRASIYACIGGRCGCLGVCTRACGVPYFLLFLFGVQRGGVGFEVCGWVSRHFLSLSFFLCGLGGWELCACACAVSGKVGCGGSSSYG